MTTMSCASCPARDGWHGYLKNTLLPHLIALLFLFLATTFDHHHSYHHHQHLLNLTPTSINIVSETAATRPDKRVIRHLEPVLRNSLARVCCALVAMLRQVFTMNSSLRIATFNAVFCLLAAPSSLAQTFTDCNPTQQQCDPAPALGRSVYIDFTQGPSSEFTAQGNPTYDSEGAKFTVSQSGDAPAIISNWYIMFGKYEITLKTAPGAGIVSSAVLQSNDLDEIDWEWLGARNDEVQTNYFGKGQTTTYDRAAVHAVDSTQGSFHTYTTEWTENQIVWQIDGETVRVLSAKDANGQYPQTPSHVRIGAWSGGDPSNSEGTVQWAQGPTDYSGGPYTMVVSSIAVTDYSTGSEYIYYDQSGDWTAIGSNGGKVNGNAGAALVDTPAPVITSTSSGNIVPFLGGDGSMTTIYTSYPGLPAGWSVNPTSGKVIPPSAAPVSEHLPLPSPTSTAGEDARWNSCTDSTFSYSTRPYRMGLRNRPHPRE